MSLQAIFTQLKNLLAHITQDLSKAEGGNKAASQRVRTGTVKLEKVAKAYRKESIKAEKGVKRPKKAGAKKAAPKKAAHKKAAPKKAAHKKAPAKKAHKVSHKPLSFKRASR